MDWNEYKSICDQPFTFSRWMLEQTVALVRDEAAVADALARVLSNPMLTKPLDHKGGRDTDMFEVRMDVAHARCIHHLVQQAALTGRRTDATRQRGLGGFEAAWREYVQFLEGHLKREVSQSTR